jgi:ABC-type spermidine/putrescine transport system permease subunit I
MRRAGQMFGWAPLAVPLAIVVLFGVGPFLAVLWHSMFEWNQMSRGHFTLRFSLVAYHELLQPHRLIAIRRILGRALAVATAGTVLAVPVGYLLVRSFSGTVRTALLLLITLPLLTSDVVRAFAWRALLRPTGLLFYETGVLVALVGSVVSLAILPVVRSFESINPSVWRASSELSTSRWTEFRYIAFPLGAWAVSVGWLASYVVGLGASVEVEVLSGATKSSIGAEISSLLSAQKLNTAYAFSVALVVTATLVWGIIGMGLWALTRWGRTMRTPEAPNQ